MHRPAGSYEQLVARHRPEILAYLVRMLGNHADAQDACQDALLRAYRAFHRLTPNSNSRAWLYKIATRGALNTLRRRKRMMARTADVDLDTLPAGSHVTTEGREQLRRVRRAVGRLPPKQRAALMQRTFQDLSYEDIGACLGCSPESARANVYQAMKKLRGMLAPRGETTIHRERGRHEQA